MSEQKDTGIGAAVEQIVTLAKSINPILNNGGNVSVLKPPGYTREDITDVVEKSFLTPLRPRGEATFTAVDSFNSYVMRHFIVNKSWLYADYDAGKIVAVFNDHGMDTAGWKDFRATFVAEKSRQLQIWKGSNCQHKDQVSFGEFLEANIADLLEPDGTTLLNVALTITASTSINFSSAKRLDNGQVQLTYNETIDAKAGATGALEIPREFTIGIPVYKHGSPYRLTARLKYRLNGGSVKFWYEIDRLDAAIEDAFKDHVSAVTQGTGQPVLTGKP